MSPKLLHKINYIHRPNTFKKSSFRSIGDFIKVKTHKKLFNLLKIRKYSYLNNNKAIYLALTYILNTFVTLKLGLVITYLTYIITIFLFIYV